MVVLIPRHAVPNSGATVEAPPKYLHPILLAVNVWRFGIPLWRQPPAVELPQDTGAVLHRRLAEEFPLCIPEPERIIHLAVAIRTFGEQLPILVPLTPDTVELLPRREWLNRSIQLFVG